ncbi:MAG: leucine-rich repeat protein [Eubacterium sp.]|nr:leucine-rich repeat protein [Eubacterium sp.]
MEDRNAQSMKNTRNCKSTRRIKRINRIEKRKGARVLSLLFSLLLCLSLTAQPVRAALPESGGQAVVTFSELNASEVFLKQSQARVCTLTASTMMIRRAAMLSGNQDWKQITEKYVRKYAWAEKTGLKWNFTAAGITVTQKVLSSKSELIRLLNAHPEGVVIYNAKKPHAILVTDYTDGILYCSDPSNDKPAGRYPIAQASITAESAGRCWYVKNPVNLTVAQTDANTAGSDFTGSDTGDSGFTGSDTGDSGLAGSDTGDSGFAGSNSGEASGLDTSDAESPGSSRELDAQEASNAALYTNQKAGNLMYRILDQQAKTAVCTGRAKNDASVTIPETVHLSGVQYRVVQVAQGAFAEADDLKEITVGANVVQIEPKAFYHCKNLQKITIYAGSLQTIGADAFAKIHKKAKLLMIGGKMEAFAKLLSGTSVPVTATVKVQADSRPKTEAK